MILTAIDAKEMPQFVVVGWHCGGAESRRHRFRFGAAG
jgi:hypothetical protein